MAGTAADWNTVSWWVGCELPTIFPNGEDSFSLSLPPCFDLPGSLVASITRTHPPARA